MSLSWSSSPERFMEVVRSTSREELELALESVFSEAQQKLIDVRSAPSYGHQHEYHTSCPEEAIGDGNYDDIFVAGQDNGIVLASDEIMDALLDKLG